MKLTHLILMLSVTFAIAGCSFEPTYQRPKADFEQNYPKDTAIKKSVDEQTGADVSWQDFFTDADLKQLISLALKNNKDLQTAALDVAEYRAEYRISRANLAPEIDLSGSSSAEHSSGKTSHSDSLTVGTSSWEIDFFGRLRSLKHQALEQYLSSAASKQSTQVSLIASVATDYLQLLADQQALAFSRQAVSDYQSSYQLAQKTLAIGSYGLSDFNTARANLAAAQADVASYQQAIAQDWHNLANVVGTAIPQSIRARHSVDILTQRFTQSIAGGLPSQLLTHRPDIIAAEHSLKAANANVGAARAAFFPTISLTSSLGFASSSLGNLFDSGSWAFTPSVSLPIFDFGSKQADLDVAKIEKKIEIVNYQQVIQTAFKEVSNALSNRQGYAKQYSAYRDYYSALKSEYELSKAKLSVGSDSLYDMLDAAQDYHSAKIQLVDIRLEQLSNQITLYKVLGGGWHQ